MRSFQRDAAAPALTATEIAAERRAFMDAAVQRAIAAGADPLEASQAASYYQDAITVTPKGGGPETRVQRAGRVGGVDYLAQLIGARVQELAGGAASLDEQLAARLQQLGVSADEASVRAPTRIRRLPDGRIEVGIGPRRDPVTLQRVGTAVRYFESKESARAVDEVCRLVAAELEAERVAPAPAVLEHKRAAGLYRGEMAR